MNTRETTQFEKELQTVLNKFSKENNSNTPDWVLANYLIGCLDAYNSAIFSRENYYGRKLKAPKMARK